MEPIVIVSTARTPQGSLLGTLKDLTAPELGTIAIQAALQKINLDPSIIDEVLMGCVLPAGLGQAPARQAALKAGIPVHTGCTTINKMCGSGMKSVMLAHDILKSGHQTAIVAGGMESMTNAPYLLMNARKGYRLGHSEILDHMMLDGLEDAYEKRHPMGYFAELCVEQYGFTREQQDQYAITSLKRAKDAIQSGFFKNEIAPVPIKTKEGIITIDQDEHPNKVNIEKIPKLSPVFLKNGTITAASSSPISDGAATLILMREYDANRQGIQPIARIIEHSAFAKAPDHFTTAPIDAIRRLLKKINWTIDQVDLFEINEAFAVVTLSAMKDLHIPHEKLNIHGGGCALGHPIGATGARIIVTLLNSLQQKGLKRGVASLCIGGGEATAVAVEMY